jgi:hypothetical protein
MAPAQQLRGGCARAVQVQQQQQQQRRCRSRR